LTERKDESSGTHEALAARFPKITVDINRRIIDYGDIVTAGGILPGVGRCRSVSR
jgi:transcriptional regulator GlxA family with amidase domain